MSRSLDDLSPLIRGKVDEFLSACKAAGVDILVTCTKRTMDEQSALYAKGRTCQGAIVTNCDGITRRSNHQIKLDGFGHAVDCCFLVNGAASWDDGLPWRLYGEAGKALDLKWGGDWTGSLVDRPHLELP